MGDVSFSNSGYGEPGPETYENFFVPHIGRPIARDLIDNASLQPGERVLDVGCGTAIVARLAREKIDDARLAGLDPNPGMLDFAKRVAGERGIEWHQASAESMPLEDEAFDVVLSQMALQFVPDKAAAMREMARVLAAGGRLVLNVVGPRPEAFAHLAESLETHISPESSKFVNGVFSLYEAGELENLVGGAGLTNVEVSTSIKTLSLPEPEDALWGYVYSTPLGPLVANASEEARSALQKDVVDKWRAFVDSGMLTVKVPVVVVTAGKD
jgi:SAM-dependent methyltransferase